MNSTIEELEVRLKRTKSDEERIDCLIILSWEYKIISNYSTAVNLLYEAITICQETANVMKEGRALNSLGTIYREKSNYIEAVECFQMSLEKAEKSRDEQCISWVNNNLGLYYSNIGDYSRALQYYELALVHNTIKNIDLASYIFNIGNIYLQLSDYSRALEYYYQSLEIAEENNISPLLPKIMGSIGIVYSYKLDYSNALEYFQNAFRISVDIGYSRGQAMQLGNIGNVYRKISDFTSALECFQKSLLIDEENGDRSGVAKNLGDIGTVYAELSNYHKALEFFEKSSQINIELNHQRNLALNLYNEAKVYSDTKFNGHDFSKALQNYFKALEINNNIGTKRQNITVNQALSELYEQTGDLAKALHHHKEYHRIEKEVFNEESDKRLKNLQIIHEVEKTKKQSEILRLENEKMKHEQDLQTKHLTTLTMSLVQQNEFLQTLRNELLRLADTVEVHIESPLKDIARRVKKQSQAQEEWAAFEAQFSMLHADFIHRLSEKFPTLSPTELKVCALLRIGLSTKEIATLMFVTLRCVETHRYRIRKKMDTVGKDNLILILNSI